MKKETLNNLQYLIFTIVVCLPFSLFFLILMYAGEIEYEMHVPTLAYQSDIVFLDSEGCYYVDCSHGIIKCDSQGNKVNVQDKFNVNNSNYWVCRTTYDEDHFYVYLRQKENLDKKMLCVYDYNLSLKTYCDISYLVNDIIDLKIYNSRLYLLYDKSREYNGVFDLYDVDIFNEKVELLAENLREYTEYRDENVWLYFHFDNLRFDYMHRISGFDRLVYDNGTYFSTDIKLSNDRKNVYLEYQNQKYTLETSINNARFYQKAYKVNDRILFAIYDRYENPQCGSSSSLCICSYGKSQIYSFDLSRKSFSLDYEFAEKTFLIDYDLEGPKYYYNKAFYINNVFYRECDEIVEGEMIVEKGRTKTDLFSCLYLSYFNGEFYETKIEPKKSN